jgi:hypothetical protein
LPQSRLLRGSWRAIVSALQAPGRFTEIVLVDKLPPQVVALVVDENQRIADPGKSWEATDAITDASLPMRRLIWAVTDGNIYVVHYERGGRGHSFHFLVVTLGKDDPKSTNIWRGVGMPARNFAAFLDALHLGEIDDTREYAH